MLPLPIVKPLTRLLRRNDGVVEWDERDGCWRIGRWVGTGHNVFDPILWCRFSSREAAQEHLDTRGLW